MIKRKRIIRVRKNPPGFDDEDFISGLEFDIINILEFGTFDLLTNLIIFYNQGKYCEDCDQDYYKCECEKCDDCLQKRCVCRFLGDDAKPKDRIRIRKIVWEFVRYLNKIRPSFGYEYLIPDRKTIDVMLSQDMISKTESNFLKNLKTSSKFPKYTSIMKELFNL